MDPLITIKSDESVGTAIPLPDVLARLYGGALRFPPMPVGRPFVSANFVTTLDGITSYDLPNQNTGGEISGKSAIDHVVMGILRACAGAVIWGAGTYAASRGFVPTPAAISPSHASAFAELRAALNYPERPLAVILSRSGNIPHDGAILTDAEQPALIITTERGAHELGDLGNTAPNTYIRTIDDAFSPADVLNVIFRAYAVSQIVLEGGPAVFGAFLAADAIDDLFLTIAPQIAGRSGDAPRVPLVAGHAFLPTEAPWGQLVTVKLNGNLLFTRYRFIMGHDMMRAEEAEGQGAARS